MSRLIICILVALLGFTEGFAQLSVKSFLSNPFDLSAATNQRIDNNGNICALVKVELPVGGCSFEGNVIGDVEFKTNHYLVYLSPRTKMLNVLCPGAESLMVTLVSPDVPNGVESKQTYRLLLDGYQGLASSPSSQQSGPEGSYLVLELSPKTNITVRIDNELQEVNNGVVSKFLNKGRHTVSAEAPGYAPYSAAIDIDNSGTRKLAVTLESVKALVTITSETPGATIKINGTERGKGSFSGELSPGEYMVEASLQGYEPNSQIIRVDERDRKTITIPALTPIYGSLDVSYQPLGATITIDGKDYGSTPTMIRDLIIGSHEVKINAAGYDPLTTTVNILQGQTTSLSGTLNPEPQDELTQLIRKAEAGDPEAQVELGNKYYKGEDVAEDDTKAAYWYRKAAEQGNARGQYWLGVMYNFGRGIPKNYSEAVNWYRKAAIQGIPQAQTNLGYMYAEGEGVPQDYSEALNWYLKAAELGDAIAPNNIGSLYYNGQGVAQDYSEAAKWYQKAADMGFSLAQKDLGRLYRDGKGVAQDYIKAVDLFRKSSEQGNAEGQANLGYMYLSGYGVDIDYAEAFRLFEKAADQGDPMGQANLGYMYENGLGVDEDVEQAIYWYKKAAAQGDEYSVEALEFLGVSY